jgi:acylphosphatase
MKSNFRCFTIVITLCFFLSEPAVGADLEAMSGVVTGDVQKVGFRAMILKQAIEFNLAGTAKNNVNGSVEFVLQGDAKRIRDAVERIEKGTDKSKNVKVKTTPGTVAANLKTFKVIGWTSTSRNITTPYDLVFTLRSDGSKISEKDAHKVYHAILRATLGPDDLKKLDDKGDDE